MKSRYPIPAVLSVLYHQGRVVLVRRGQPPNQNRWGFPGGKIEPGETFADAAVRELQEETGVRARAGRQLTTLDAIGYDANQTLTHHYLLIAVECHWLSGEPLAASDAAEARWVAVNEMETTDLDLIDRVAEVANLVATSAKTTPLNPES